MQNSTPAVGEKGCICWIPACHMAHFKGTGEAPRKGRKEGGDLRDGLPKQRRERLVPKGLARLALAQTDAHEKAQSVHAVRRHAAAIAFTSARGRATGFATNRYTQSECGVLAR